MKKGKCIGAGLVLVTFIGYAGLQGCTKSAHPTSAFTPDNTYTATFTSTRTVTRTPTGAPTATRTPTPSNTPTSTPTTTQTATSTETPVTPIP